MRSELKFGFGKIALIEAHRIQIIEGRVRILKEISEYFFLLTLPVKTERTLGSNSPDSA
jgi:hypothetical protein